MTMMLNQISKMSLKMKRTIKTIISVAAVFVLLTAASTALAAPSDQTDVRAAVQRIFNQLKNGEYSSLYDALPASARSRTSRERLVQGLQRTQDTFELQKIDIGQVSVSGNLAVVDTTMYAHVKPFNADGKLIVQQYLIREDDGWKVATGDTATINRFLQSNPTFAKRFPIKKPQAFVYQNNKWMPLPLGPRR
jgi:hypothetical protein